MTDDLLNGDESEVHGDKAYASYDRAYPASIVHLGIFSEFLLPLLIVIGLFTRIAALGMSVYVVVQSYVDIAFHGVEAETIGALLDRFFDASILNQRLLWLFPLLYLVIRGPGKISVDYLLRRSTTPSGTG